MTKAFLALIALMCISHLVSAQNHNTLWCDKNPDLKIDYNLQMQKSSGGKLNFIAKWGGKNGASTLSAQNVEITNGTCLSCPFVGQIGQNNPQQNWVIQATDPSKPVTLAWRTQGTIALCGTGKLLVPASSFK